MKKLVLSAVTIALAALAVNHFASNNTIQPDSPQQIAQNELPLVTFVAPWELSNLNPSQSGVIFLRMNLAETLVEVNDHGEMIGGLAESWLSDESGTKWMFTLRPNVLFHDGSPLNAQAVEKSLNFALAQPSILKKAFISSIRALNSNQLEITLSKPFELLPSFLSHYSTIILAEKAYDANGNVQQLIGTGAFKPTKIEPPQKLEAVRFEEYWGKKPQVLQANYLASSRPETRLLMAQSEPSAIVYNLDKSSIARLKNDPNLTVHSDSIARTIQVKMNLAKPFFNDIVIRQALSQAIDRKAIAENVLKIQDGIAEQILPKAFADWRITVPDQQKTLAEIKQNLIDNGYQYNAEGKLLNREGVPFKFTLRTFPDRPELPITATILQEQWKKLGIDVNVAIGNFSEIAAGHQDGSLEMGLYTLNYAKTADPFGVIVQDFGKNGSDWGVMNWQNAELDHILAQIEVERDPTKAKALKQRVSQIIYDELPIIPIVYDQQNAANHNEVKGVTLDPFERRFYLERLSK